MDLDAFDWAAFGREFFDRYTASGFGRLPKREIDILVFHLIEQAGHLTDETETRLAQALRSTPRRIAGLRQDARYLYWDDAHRAAEVRRQFFGEIASENYLVEGDRIAILVPDPFVRQAVEDALRRDHRFYDTSFNRQILRVDAVTLGVLMEAFLSQEQREALLADPRVAAMLGEEGLAAVFSRKLGEAGKDLGTALSNEVIKKGAAALAASAIKALPGLLLLL